MVKDFAGCMHNQLGHACKDDWFVGAGPTCLGPELLGLFVPSLRGAILGLQSGSTNGPNLG